MQENRRTNRLQFLPLAIYFLSLIAWYSVYPTRNSSPIDEIFIGLILIFFATAFIQKKAYQIYLFLLIYFTVSIFGSITYDSGLPQQKSALYDFLLDCKLIVLFIFFSHYFRSLRNPENTLRNISKLFIALALLNFPFILHDMFFLENVHGNAVGVRNGIAQPLGLYAHTTESAWRFLVGYLSALYLIKKERKNLKYRIISILFFFTVLLHASAKEATVLIVVSLLYLTVNKGLFGSLLTPRNALIATLSVTAFASIAGKTLIDRLDLFISNEAATTTARTALYAKSLEIAGDRFPIGVGGGSFASMPSYTYGYSNAYRDYQMDSIWGASEEMSRFLMDAHWPKIIGQGGFLGFVAYLLLLKSCLLFKSVRHLRRSYENWLIGCVSLTILIISFASSPFTNEFLSVCLALYLGILANLPKKGAAWRLSGK